MRKHISIKTDMIEQLNRFKITYLCGLETLCIVVHNKTSIFTGNYNCKNV